MICCYCKHIMKKPYERSYVATQWISDLIYNCVQMYMYPPGWELNSNWVILMLRKSWRHVHMHTHTCIHTQKCKHTYTRSQTNTYTYMHIHTQQYTHAHTHTYTLRLGDSTIFIHYHDSLSTTMMMIVLLYYRASIRHDI